MKIIKKINNFFSNLTIKSQYKKLEADFEKVKAEADAFEEESKAQLAEIDLQIAELPEGNGKNTMVLLAEALKEKQELTRLKRQEKFASTRVYLDILRLSIV